MSSKKESALSKIQSLYLMQVELWDFLEDNNADAEKAKMVQKTLKEFTTLLSEVDPQYMGGEDVLETLQWIPGEVKQKLKKAPTSAKATVGKPKKAVAAPARKKAKKPSAKKSKK